MSSFKDRNIYALIIFLIILFIVPASILVYLIQPETGCTDREILFRTSTFGSAELWDPAISDGINLLYKYYSINCLESLFYFPEDSIDPKSSLATSWDIEYWLEENNSLGYINRGGVKALNITLREGVKFHDGSSWNATAAKWNIDRLYVLSGNLTGNAVNLDMTNIALFWSEVESVKPFFTANWNLSRYDADGITFTSDQYAGYNIEENVTLSNPNPYGGWDPVKADHLHYAPYDMYPIINQVKEIEKKESGGKIRVEFNDWNSDGYNNLLLPMISMQTYKDYFERGIYGYMNDILTLPNPTIVDHMIGTGPYIYIEHDESGTPPGGSMKKNVNYWNKTALEAERWFDADIIELIKFPSDELGNDALNTAISTHYLDYIVDNNPYYYPDYDAIMSNPTIAYINYGVTDYITQITLNCINETWWSWGPPYNYRDNISNLYSDQGTPNGIPRALRKAISFAFDYDSYINVTMDQRNVRVNNMLGSESMYLNSSIPIAYYNLTKAREILLKTEDDTYTYTYNQDSYNFSKLCSSRGLNVSSTDAEWQWVAENNPIYTFNFYWDSAHEDLKNAFQNSLKNIGVGLDIIGNTNGIPSQVSPFFNTFDGNYSIWSSHSWTWDYHIPSTFSDLSVVLSFRDTNYGLWRDDPWAPSTDPRFSWWPNSNYAFCYDEDVDEWLNRIIYSNRTGKQIWFSKIANKIQNEIYPMIFVSQGIKSLFLWKDWSMNLNRGELFFANFNYSDFCDPQCRPSIAGYSIYFIIGFLAISSCIILIIKKKSISNKQLIN